MRATPTIQPHIFAALISGLFACGPEAPITEQSEQAALTGDNACAHPLCEEGAAVDPSCHSCAASICAADPFCCSSGWDALCVSHVASICNESCDAAPSCGHDICETGDALDAGCGQCAADICAADPFCCSSGWDSICVGEVQSICGQSCNAPECAHDVCETGEALDASCDSCVASVCAADPFCCNGQWDRLCTNQVETICGQSCEAPPAECAHPLCDAGAPLDPACDDCAASVCAADPFCCNVSWDQLCVSQVDSICGDQTPVAADIIFVVDNSGSMADEQAQLSQNFRTLLDHVQNQSIDFKIAVTTTDVSPTGERGAFVGPVITPQTQNPDSVFASNVQVGTTGAPFEQGLEASRLALSTPQVNSGFLRADASLVVIYLSDEDDQSPDTVANYVNFLQGLKNGPPVALNSIVGDVPSGCQGSSSASAGDRYVNASNATGGAFSSICSADWSAALTNVPVQSTGICGP